MSDNNPIDIRGLSYIVAESTDLKEWENYAHNVLGAMATFVDDNHLHIKIDERQQRMLIQKGEKNGYVSSGWEVLSQKKFEAAKKTLQAHNVAFEVGDEAACKLRSVQEMISFADPSGNVQEVVWGFKSDFVNFASPTGVKRFVTGDQGMGHTVLPAPDFAKTVAFYREVMGFDVSDIMNFMPGGPDGPTLPIYFLHCNNPRHHSLALAAFPVESGCVHMMLEVEDMPTVGRAYDAMLANNVKLSATLGQHTNDKMTSFYMKTPSGFDLEYGYGGHACNWDEHIVHEFTKVSLWGHDFTVGQQG